MGPGLAPGLIDMLEKSGLIVRVSEEKDPQLILSVTGLSWTHRLSRLQMAHVRSRLCAAKVWHSNALGPKAACADRSQTLETHNREDERC